MKNLTPFILVLSAFCSLAQTVETKTDTLVYKLDEKFEISFDTDFSPDSNSTISFSKFEIISGPIRSHKMTSTAGVITSSVKITYTLRPIVPGSFEITSPVFYDNGTAYQCDPVTITIIGDPLTKQEIEYREFVIFTEKSIKPDGTTRLVIKDQFGYIEVYSGGKWVYKRRLTPLELKTLGKL